MMALAAKGLGRQEAHKLVRDAAQIARTKGIPLRDALIVEPRVSKFLPAKELDAALDPGAYLGQSASIVDATLKRVR
jgi:adenylosuccinate lyase